MVARGAAATRGVPHPTRGTNRGTGRGARAATRGGTQPQAQAADQMETGEEEEEDEDEDEYPSLQAPEAPRGRRGSKRGADSQEEGATLEGRPPEKR